MILKKSGGNRAFFLVPSLCREEVTMKKILQLLVTVICAAVASVSVQAQEARYVKVINETGVTVERVYLSHQNRPGWGSDRLGSQVLPSGYNIRVYPADESLLCRYDLRAEFVDGRSTQRFGANICGGANWTLYQEN